MRPILPFLTCLLALLLASRTDAAGEKLYGVHWWTYDRPNVGPGPTGGWSVETVLTDSDPWQQGWWFEPLYQQVKQNHNAELITRIDYTWVGGNITVPHPTTTPTQNWANKIVSDIIGPLGPYATRWQIGNEPNILGEGNGWPENKITPQGYAQIYHTVRQTIKAQRPNDEVLFAPVSPGGVIDGVRWKDGNQWLAEAIDATLALGGTIDGFTVHAYGDPFASAASAVAGFRNDYQSQLAVIDSRGLQHTPVYLTEWTRGTWTQGNLAANEQVTADFIRLSMEDVDRWNRIPGNHNIRSMGWFVNAGSGWHEYSLQWWRSQGNPEGHPGDLWTAFLQGGSYQAGMVGTRPRADYNWDGLVNAADWNAWRAAFGRTDHPFADGSRNGRVDAADYVLWRKTTTAAGAASHRPVPEPATVFLTMFATITMVLLQRHIRR